MKNILWAVDGSEGSIKAGKMVGQFLDAFPESNVIALHVKQQPTFIDMGMGVVPLSFNDSLEKKAKQLQVDVEEQFSAYLRRFKFISTNGTPAITICKVAEEENVDLIIIGSHGYGAVDRVILGSVSNSVVHRSHIPTLVVK